MRFLGPLLTAIAVALAVGFGFSWYTLNEGSLFGTITVGPWSAWEEAGTATPDPYTRAHVARNSALQLGASEGLQFVATTDSDLVSEGVLQRYLLGSYSARKLGLASTGNAGGVHNLLVTGSSEDPGELLKRVGRGLLVTELMGQGANTLTGDYSRGASGFWVEDGQIAWPVSEATIAGHLAQMFLDIEALGSDIDLRSHLRSGSVLVSRMTVAGAESE